MPGRVLNFFEFSDKYSSGEATEKDLQDVTSAAANFADGFDDSTYDQPEIKPNRPVNGEYATTPASPTGFNPESSKEMAAPVQKTEEPNDSEEEDDDDEDEKDEEVEEGNPEESNESMKYAKSFRGYVNEMYSDYAADEKDPESGMPYTMEPDSTLGLDPYEVDGADSFGYYPEGEDVCPDCGEDLVEDEYGVNCGCNM
jgi:hypothetical protein